VVDVNAAVAALADMGAAMDAACREIVVDGAHIVQAASMGFAPVGDRPGGGQLRRSIDVKGPRPSALGGWEAEVGPTVIYGRQRELGGHIFPVRATRLHWVDAAGVDHYASHVYQHPEPYMKPGLASSRAAVYALAAEKVAAAIEGG